MFILTLFCHPCLKEGETDFLRPLFSIQLLLVAELRRAKRASGAPWVIAELSRAKRAAEHHG